VLLASGSTSSWTPTDPVKLLAKVQRRGQKPGGTVIVEDHVARPARTRSAGIDKTAPHRTGRREARISSAPDFASSNGESKVLGHPEDDHTKIVFDELGARQDGPVHLSIPEIVRPDSVCRVVLSALHGFAMRGWTDFRGLVAASDMHEITTRRTFRGLRCVVRARGTIRTALMRSFEEPRGDTVVVDEADLYVAHYLAATGPLEHPMTRRGDPLAADGLGAKVRRGSCCRRSRPGARIQCQKQMSHHRCCPV
jgi:hypothetical protein